MLSQEDLAQIIALTDTKYVQKDACNDRHTELAKELTEVSVTQATILTKLGNIEKINATTLGTVAAAIVASLMKLILK